MTVECLSLCHGISTSQENSFDGVCRKRRDARLLSVLVFKKKKQHFQQRNNNRHTKKKLIIQITKKRKQNNAMRITNI